MQLLALFHLLPMVTNRKKLKQKKRKTKLLLGFFVVIVVIGGLLGFLFHKVGAARSVYISPLAQSNILGVSGEQKISAQLQQQLQEKKIDYVTMRPSSDSYIVDRSNGSEIVISTKKDLKTQISSLQYILQRLTMEGKQFKRLDLQFDKPIIIFK